MSRRQDVEELLVERQIPPICAGCAKRKGIVCEIITDIWYPWLTYQSCWAYEEDKDWKKRIKAETKTYERHMRNRSA